MAIAVFVAAGVGLLQPMTRRVAAQMPAFHASVDMVALNVTATDGSGHFAANLTRDDFAVLEDGQKQHILFLQRSEVPLSVALLIDTSNSMLSSLPEAQKAAVGLVHTLGPADLAAVMPFKTTVRASQPFTSDQMLLADAIHQTIASGYTALYDTIYVTLDQFHRAKGSDGDVPRRKAILLVTDGVDSASLTSFDDLLDAALHSDVAIYAVVMLPKSPANDDPEGVRFVLNRLAAQTGGRAFFPKDPDMLDDVYRAIKAELSNQYLIGYESNDPRHDGRFRHVQVAVTRPKIEARTRPGYFAPGGSPAASRPGASEN